MSFNPLKAQIELAFANAPVCFPEPEPAAPGVPGGPCTSPARAAPALRPASATAQTAVTNIDFFYGGLDFTSLLGKSDDVTDLKPLDRELNGHPPDCSFGGPPGTWPKRRLGDAAAKA